MGCLKMKSVIEFEKKNPQQEKFMKLRMYLVKNRITVAKFSKMMGYNSSYFSQLLCGNKKFSKTAAILIEFLTNGEVKAEDVLNEKDFQQVA